MQIYFIAFFISFICIFFLIYCCYYNAMFDLVDIVLHIQITSFSLQPYSEAPLSIQEVSITTKYYCSLLFIFKKLQYLTFVCT